MDEVLTKPCACIPFVRTCLYHYAKKKDNKQSSATGLSILQRHVKTLELNNG